MSVLAIDIPNPLAPVADGIGGALGAGARKAGEAILGSVADAIVRGLSAACEKVSSEVLHFLDASSGVHLDQGWWASPRTQDLVRTVGGLAGLFMVGFLLLAVIQGLLAGDPGAMVRTALLEVPISVAATVVLVSVTQLLLGVTDEASSAVLRGVPGDLGRFFAGFGVAAHVGTHGFAGIVMLVLFLVGALLVWIELTVRASLIYWLVAAAPLLAAARVWPAARGAFRRLCEIGMALIFAKFAIALALALGAAALAGGGPQSGDLGTKVGLDLAGLLTGATLMLLAAFTPFVLLRLLPILEVAVAAQGISRMPARAAQTGMQAGYHATGLSRIAGGGPRPPGPGPAGNPGGGDTPGPAGSAGPAGAGGSPAASAGPAAVAVPVGAAAVTARVARRTAEGASAPAGAGTPPSPAGRQPVAAGAGANGAGS